MCSKGITETRDIKSANRMLTDPDLKDCSAVITYRIGYGQYNAVCPSISDAVKFMTGIETQTGNFDGLLFYRLTVGSALDLLREFVD